MSARDAGVGWRVGALARRTGLTVRTLHYYDEIGLLSPSLRSDAGYRLYQPAEVARLQQITSLRHMGLSLAEITTCLDHQKPSVLEVIRLHLDQLRAHISLQHDLIRRLETIAAHLSSADEVSVEEFLQTMEVMDRMDTYYTPEQLAQLERRRTTVGDERIRQVEAEWPVLMAAVRAEMDRGTNPADPRVQALARQWMGLVEEFTGGDPGIGESLGKMWQQEQSIHSMETSPVREMMAYLGPALAAIKQQE